MENLTSVNKIMRLIEKVSPNLLNIHSSIGRNFIKESNKILNEEKEHIKEAFFANDASFEEFYNKKYNKK